MSPSEVRTKGAFSQLTSLNVKTKLKTTNFENDFHIFLKLKKPVSFDLWSGADDAASKAKTKWKQTPVSQVL